MSNEFSKWNRGRGLAAVLHYFDDLPKTAANRRGKRATRRAYRLHHDRYYKPLIHNGRKP